MPGLPRWLAAGVLLLLCLFAGHAQALPEGSWVIAIGNNRGDASESPLLFAERDAQQLADVLHRQGGVRSDRLRVLLDEDAETVLRTLTEVNAALQTSRAQGQTRATLVVFYSGHADAMALHLRSSLLPFEVLRQQVVSSSAALRLLIVDSCRSGSVTRVKGLRSAPEFALALDDRLDTAGSAILSSGTADENSQESDRLRGSFFSHHLINALRGVADGNGDGRITLSEAFAYTQGQTLRSSGQTLSLQHPTFSYDLKGSHELVLTTLLPDAATGSRLRLATRGTYLITEDRASGAVVAELTSARESALIALPSGRYFVQQRGRREYREYQLTLLPGAEIALNALPYRVIVYDALVRKRGGDRVSIHGLSLLGQARGEVLPGIGAAPNLLLGYSADLAWGTLGTRLRGGFTRWDSQDGGLQGQRYEVGLSLLAQRYVDLPWLTLAIGVSLEGIVALQRFSGERRVAEPRNSLLVSFAALLALERRLFAGLSLRLEGGPVAALERRAKVESGAVVDIELASVVTYAIGGGLVWRL